MATRIGDWILDWGKMMMMSTDSRDEITEGDSDKLSLERQSSEIGCCKLKLWKYVYIQAEYHGVYRWVS